MRLHYWVLEGSYAMNPIQAACAELLKELEGKNVPITVNDPLNSKHAFPGNLVPASQAHLAIFDAGIVLGATVTEMTRTFRHEPYRLDDHLDRRVRVRSVCLHA